MIVKQKKTPETSNLRQEVAAAVAAAVAEAAVAAAKVLAESSLERRVSLIENQLGELQLEIKKGNLVIEAVQTEIQAKGLVIDEILEVVKISKGLGKVFAWIASIGSAIATMAIAWHWYK